MHKRKNKVKNVQNKEKKNRKKLEIILVLFLSIVVLVMFMMSPIFNISEFIVYGSSRYTTQEIIKASGVSTGVNGFKNIGGNYKHYISLRYGQAEKNLTQKYPYIKEAIVRYSIPDTVIIEITEREPLMLVPYLGTYLIVDRDGYVVETSGDKEKYNLPEVKGLKFTKYEIGQPLIFENKKIFNEVIFLIDTLTKEDKNDNLKIVELINSIDISDKNNIHLTIDNRIMVNIGSIEKIDYKIRSLKQIYYKNIGDDEKGFLNFTTGDYPVFIPN